MRKVPLPWQLASLELFFNVQVPTTTPLLSVPMTDEVPFVDVPVRPSW
jgi:hypothetical protein